MTKKNKNDLPVILVCIDSSNASVIALKYAHLKAKKLGFKIEVLSVLEQSHKNLLFGSHTISRENRKKAEIYIEKAIKKIFDKTSDYPSVNIREGEVANEIIKEVRSNSNIVNLVLGKSQSSSQSDNNVLSKLADKISKKVNVPILIVPENIDSNIFKLMI